MKSFLALGSGRQLKLFWVLLALMAVFALLPFASAKIIEETAFSSLGYENFVVSGAETSGCAEYAFVSDMEKPIAERNTQYTIFSVHAAFEPVAERDANISVFFNSLEEAIAVLPATSFLDGWARVGLPRSVLQAENVVVVCTNTSHTTAKITVINDSKVGTYLKPDFSSESGFEVTASTLTPKQEQDFRIYVTLRNYGSEGTDVFMRYRYEHLDTAMPEIEVVEGELEKSGYISPCEERDENGMCTKPSETVFVYTAKPVRATIMTLLPAVLRYTNIFGEEITKESNRLVIEAVLPEINIKPFIISTKQNYVTGETAQFRLAVKNEGRDALHNLQGIVTTTPGLELFGSALIRIEEIKPGETLYFDFNANAGAVAGNYSIGCGISYIDYNVEETACEAFRIGYEQPQINTILIAAALLAVVAAAVYAYIHFR